MSEYSQALKETTKYLNPPVGFVEGDMNENNLITYIAPDLKMPIKEFIEKMSLGFQTKGYEDFKGTNLLVSITS